MAANLRFSLLPTPRPQAQPVRCPSSGPQPGAPRGRVGPAARGQEVIFWSRVLGKEVLGERQLRPSHVYLSPAPCWLNRLSFIRSPIKPWGALRFTVCGWMPSLATAPRPDRDSGWRSPSQGLPPELPSGWSSAVEGPEGGVCGTGASVPSLVHTFISVSSCVRRNQGRVALSHTKLLVTHSPSLLGSKVSLRLL